VNIPLIREFSDQRLPTTFRQLSPGDIFNTSGIQDYGRDGFTVTCLKLACGQSLKGNTVITYGELAGYIVQLELSAEVELLESSRECMNALLHDLRVERRGGAVSRYF